MNLEPNPMNKDELITAIAAKTGFNKKSAQEALDAVLETIMDVVRDGDKVAIGGFGTFLLIERKARKARNPRTGEVIEVPVRKEPKFLPGKQFKEAAK
jgi:DNA-binding protein HU-beta